MTRDEFQKLKAEMKGRHKSEMEALYEEFKRAKQKEMLAAKIV